MAVGWTFVRLSKRKSICAAHKSFNFRIYLMRDLNIIDHSGGENRNTGTSSTKGKPTDTELVHHRIRWYTM